ncbi:hypothetical protein OH76DRAFT_1424389, partial [Lentinus brumalis]
MRYAPGNFRKSALHLSNPTWLYAPVKFPTSTIHLFKLHQITQGTGSKGLKEPGSNHAPLLTRVLFMRAAGEHTATISPRNSELNAEFVEDVFFDMIFVAPACIGSVDELDRHVNRLMSAFAWAWNGNAVVPNICDRSRHWWDGPCTSASRVWAALDDRSYAHDLNIARSSLGRVILDHASAEDTTASLLAREPSWLHASPDARR